VTNNGTPIAANQWVTVSNLSGLAFVGAATPGTDQIWLEAYNGVWSNASQATLTDAGLVAPVVTALSAMHGQVFAASSLFMLDGEAITQYDFWNTGSGGGYFAVNGVALGANQDDYVSAAQLSQTTYQSGAGTDTLWVRVSDGAQWSPWSQSFTVTAPVDTGPTVTPASANISATHNQSLAASSLFTASDPFGDPITQYEFSDTRTGGR
jgi:hypothetical protein